MFLFQNESTQSYKITRSDKPRKGYKFIDSLETVDKMKTVVTLVTSSDDIIVISKEQLEK